MAANPIQIYAELLPNIGQISIYASFYGPRDAATSIAVLQDGVTLRAQHHGQSKNLRLPGVVAPAGSRLPIPKQSAQQPQQTHDTLQASWRLPLVGGSLGRQDPSTSSIVPWSAPDLSPGTKVSCRACKATLVPEERISVWKDLPSENWAEMMEFWHCHKPDDHHGHGHGHQDDAAIGNGKPTSESLASRGYGANSAISAQTGIGFVDLVSLVFEESDCRGLVFSTSSYDSGSSARQNIPAEAVKSVTASQSLNVFCSSCKQQVGCFNFRMESVTLFKWQIQCDAKIPESPSIAECLAATLMTTISRSGSSKSLIMPIYGLPPNKKATETSSTKVLHIWVLNSNIRYASSNQSAPVLAIKLLYKLISREDADSMLERINSDAQEINLPVETIRAVSTMLGSSSLLLPAKERLYMGWSVGLLKRWEPIEC